MHHGLDGFDYAEAGVHRDFGRARAGFTAMPELGAVGLSYEYAGLSARLAADDADLERAKFVRLGLVWSSLF